MPRTDAGVDEEPLNLFSLGSSRLGPVIQFSGPRSGRGKVGGGNREKSESGIGPANLPGKRDYNDFTAHRRPQVVNGAWGGAGSGIQTPALIWQEVGSLFLRSCRPAGSFERDHRVCWRSRRGAWVDGALRAVLLTIFARDVGQVSWFLSKVS